MQKLRSPSATGSRSSSAKARAPADLFADDGTGFWHTHLLAQFTVRATVSRGKVTISVRDAGDPVAGAAITVGGKHLKTDGNGRDP